MKKILFTLLFLFQLSVFGRTITVGCSYVCDSDVSSSLREAAADQNLKIKILNLPSLNSIPWSTLDGIVFPGGADINPQFYLNKVERELQDYTKNLDHLIEYTSEGKKRDPFEYNLLQEIHTRHTQLPVLGICRGMQMLAVSVGIPLYVDIKTELGIPNRRDLYDRVVIDESLTTIGSIFPELNLLGYKYHHQGIRVPYYLDNKSRWPDISVTAFSNDRKIAESFEIRNRPVLGVQFHPENDKNNVRKAIFNWFISKAAGQNH